MQIQFHMAELRRLQPVAARSSPDPVHIRSCLQLSICRVPTTDVSDLVTCIKFLGGLNDRGCGARWRQIEHMSVGI